MKQHWQQALLKIDSLTLRERIIVFALACVLTVSLFTLAVFDKQFAKIKQLSSQISQTQGHIEQARKDVRQGLIDYRDPNEDNIERLQALQQELPVMRNALLDLHKGLVSPVRMTSLLQDITRGRTNLQLLSLKTLPATNLVTKELTSLTPGSGQAALATAAALVTKPDAIAVYTHGVELVVQGSYPAIFDYVKQLESMPWQLLWNEAKLEVREYPIATLKLTVYSLSLDKKWLNL